MGTILVSEAQPADVHRDSDLASRAIDKPHYARLSIATTQPFSDNNVFKDRGAATGSSESRYTVGNTRPFPIFALLLLSVLAILLKSNQADSINGPGCDEVLRRIDARPDCAGTGVSPHIDSIHFLALPFISRKEVNQFSFSES
jgi:hypothetical protein